MDIAANICMPSGLVPRRLPAVRRRGFVLWMRDATSRSIGSREERRLVKTAQSGSTESIERLFQLHWPRAHRAAYLVVRDAAAAEDIAQEAFLAAVRNLDRFDRRRPFGPWLNRIVVNRSIDWVRLRKLRAEAQLTGEGEGVPRAIADDLVEDGPSLDGEVSERLMTALGSLSPEHRGVVVLRYLLEYTPSEIASILELPRGTVNSRLRRGLDQLAPTYAEESG